MFHLRRIAPVCAMLVLGAGLAACAPTNNSTVDRSALGAAGYVSYGTIVQTRPVAVQGSRSGVGAGAGAVAGGLLGSTIGGDWRARTVAGVVGALAGGVAGAVIEDGVTRGNATEFIVRGDDGTLRSFVQTNEAGLQVGERVVVTQTDRARLSRVGGPGPGGYGAPPPGYGAPPPGYGGGYSGPIDARGAK